MVYLNYNNLDAETQDRLLSNSKADIKQQFGDDLKAYAREHRLDFDVSESNASSKHRRLKSLVR